MAGSVSGFGVGFGVDLDEMARVVAAIDACDASYHALGEDLAARSTALHGTWQGAAADAHLLAQARWEHGFGQMREALRALHAVASGDQANYTAAASTNVEMWERIR